MHGGRLDLVDEGGKRRGFLHWGNGARSLGMGGVGRLVAKTGVSSC